MINNLTAINAYTTALKPAKKPENAGAQFGEAFKSIINNNLDTLKASETVSLSASTGRPELTALVTSVSNAEITLNTMVAVRDRVLQAYQEITRMQI